MPEQDMEVYKQWHKGFAFVKCRVVFNPKFRPNKDCPAESICTCKRQFSKLSFNITSLIISLQAIDIEDAIYMIVIGMNKSNLTDSPFLL
jgi:hypothetical protein